MLTDVAATRETVLRLISLKAIQEASEEAEAEMQRVKYCVYSTDFWKTSKKATKINDTSQNTRRIVWVSFFSLFFYEFPAYCRYMHVDEYMDWEMKNVYIFNFCVCVCACMSV